jgi:hypothetical protein
VDVVGHKDISINLEAVPLSILLQPLQIILSIRVTSKDDLALVTTTDHMIKGAGKPGTK